MVALQERRVNAEKCVCQRLGYWARNLDKNQVVTLSAKASLPAHTRRLSHFAGSAIPLTGRAQGSELNQSTRLSSETLRRAMI